VPARLAASRRVERELTVDLRSTATRQQAPRRPASVAAPDVCVPTPRPPTNPGRSDQTFPDAGGPSRVLDSGQSAAMLCCRLDRSGPVARTPDRPVMVYPPTRPSALGALVRARQKRSHRPQLLNERPVRLLSTYTPLSDSASSMRITSQSFVCSSDLPN